jgi:primosomal replication protein N
LKRNQVVLSGEVTQLEQLRFTPAGIPLLSFVLSHDSSQAEAGLSCQTQFRVPARALGEVALSMQVLSAGADVTLQGFLGRRGRHGDRLMLHIVKFKMNGANNASSSEEGI